MSDEIVKLLENKRLRETVVKTIQEVYSYAGTLHDNPSEDMEDIGEEDLWEEAWWRAEVYGEKEKIDDAFDKYVFSKMPTPLTIYPKEILSEFYQLMCPGGIGCPELETIDFDNLYTTFIHKVNLNVMSLKTSGPFPICIVCDTKDDFNDGLIKGINVGLKGMEDVKRLLEYEVSKEDSAMQVLWEQRNLKICLSFKSPYRNRRFKERAYLNAYVVGHMSKEALDSLQSSLPEVLQTAARSLSLLYNKEKGTVNAQGFIPYDGEKLHGYAHGLPVIREAVLHENKDTVRAFLDSYFDQMTKTRKRKKGKDSFVRRIRNAALLLIESDTQRNDAIGMALSVSAIEALLGEKGSDISERISTNVAVLLEPDLEKRQAATEFVKDIYDKRSRALHGEQLDGESSCRLKARHLASAILCAIISGLNLLRRSGSKPENPDGLLQNLRKSRFTKGQPFGVEEFNVRGYWT